MATAEFDREAVRELYDLRSSRQQGYTETFEGDFDAELSRLRDAAPAFSIAHEICALIPTPVRRGSSAAIIVGSAAFQLSGTEHDRD